jgi:hypothetical protein
MREVFAHVYEACRTNKIPIDVSPNIEVSLIVQPGDTVYLAPDTLPSRWYQARLRLMRQIAKPYFWWQTRPKQVDTPDVLVQSRNNPYQQAGRSSDVDN